MKKMMLICTLLCAVGALNAGVLYPPGQSHFITIDPGRMLRYIEIDWYDSAEAGVGRLYLNGVAYGAADVANASSYMGVFLPAIYRWDNINTYAANAYITFENATVEVFNVRTVYLDYVDWVNAPWYYNGWYVMIAVDSSRVLRYIEVDWRSNYYSSTGTLYTTTLNASGQTVTGSQGGAAVGTGSFIYGNLYLPDSHKWNIDAYCYNAYIYITGGNDYYSAVQIFQIRVVYNDSGSFYPYPGVTDPSGVTNWSYNYNNYTIYPSATNYNYPSFPYTGPPAPTPAYPNPGSGVTYPYYMPVYSGGSPPNHIPH
ncbi:MAG: hypothetical protein PHQ23_02815 [Candidatus Wallbacteria bacterium]|nr:hypothetical protein [Candidatus Wallbacteria bacterium]